MPELNTAGAVTHYEDEYFGDPWREPAPVLLIHGVAESSRAWYGWVPHLARSMRVLRPDLPGFGGSSVPKGYDWSTTSFAASLAGFLDAVGVDRAHVVGAKLGAAIGLQFVADYPERARSFSFVSGPVRAHDTGGRADLSTFPDLIRREGVRGWAAQTQRARLGSEVPEEQIAWWSEFMGGADPEVCIAVTGMAGGFDLTGLLGGVKVPTLVVTTADSALASVETVRSWQEAIPGSELLVLPGDSYHIAAASPDECAGHVLEFIRRRGR